MLPLPRANQLECGLSDAHHVEVPELVVQRTRGIGDALEDSPRLGGERNALYVGVAVLCVDHAVGHGSLLEVARQRADPITFVRCEGAAMLAWA